MIEYGVLSFMYTEYVREDGTPVEHPLRNPQDPVYIIFLPQILNKLNLFGYVR
jgi:hypothetical protein